MKEIAPEAVLIVSIVFAVLFLIGGSILAETLERRTMANKGLIYYKGYVPTVLLKQINNKEDQ